MDSPKKESIGEEAAAMKDRAVGAAKDKSARRPAIPVSSAGERLRTPVARLARPPTTLSPTPPTRATCPVSTTIRRLRARPMAGCGNATTPLRTSTS